MSINRAKDKTSLQDKDIYELFMDLNTSDTYSNYDLKLELLSRINETMFTTIMLAIKENVLASNIHQIRIIDEAVKLTYNHPNIHFYIDSLSDMFESEKKNQITFDKDTTRTDINEMLGRVISKKELKNN